MTPPRHEHLPSRDNTGRFTPRHDPAATRLRLVTNDEAAELCDGDTDE